MKSKLQQRLDNLNRGAGTGYTTVKVKVTAYVEKIVEIPVSGQVYYEAGSDWDIDKNIDYTDSDIREAISNEVKFPEVDGWELEDFDFETY